MIASFFIILVAFAICQAILTVKFADFLSPKTDSESVVVGPRSAVGSAKLA